MARRPQYAPINHISWKDMPKKDKDEMLETIESKFEFVPPINDTTREMLKTGLNEKWRQWKSDLKSMAYDPSKTEEEVASTLPDDRVDPNQYRELVRYWFSEKGQKVSKVNRQNRAKYEDIHCMGTKSLPKLIDEKEELNKHNCEVGTFQVTQKSQIHMPWKDDIYEKVQGPDKRGRARCVGKIPKTKKLKKVVLSENHELHNRVKHTENILLNVLRLIENRFSGEDVNDILQAARQATDASSVPGEMNSQSPDNGEDNDTNED